jgi:S-adenosylmethionine synthetase
MQILFSKNSHNTEFEIVERKGVGHPDTLSDHLAEYLSVKYSHFTREKFGAVLHHNFDKVGLLGGKSSVQFGSGKLISPIRVLINGRASFSFGDEQLDVWGMLVEWTRDFLLQKFPNIDPETDIVCMNNLSTASSPGQQKDNIWLSARNFWFQPRSQDDLPELKQLFSNDTSVGVGFAPYSKLETLVLRIEDMLSSNAYKANNEWIGSDIKIMGARHGEKYFITMCIPQIADKVNSVTVYLENIARAKKDILAVASQMGIVALELNVNTRDSAEKNEFYLTAIGSSIESGDEGLVGRGNRVNRLITPNRIMCMEGAAGKNPIYHIGKVYHLFAHKLAHAIYEKFSVENSISIVSQSGRDLNDPWIVSIETTRGIDDETKAQIESFVNAQTMSINDITSDILSFKYPIA